MSEVHSRFRILAIAAMAAVVAAFAFFRLRNLDLDAALNGLSPEQIAMLTNRPDMFVHDFPSGALEALKSIIFHVYPIAMAIGLDVSMVWGVMIMLELVLFMAASYWATRLIFPRAGGLLAGVVALLFSMSSLLEPDLARFGFPYYGWNYAFAMGGLLVLVALCLRGRLVACAVTWAAVFLVHPIVAVFGAIFCGGIMAVRLVEGRFPRLVDLVAPVLIAGVVASAWLYWISANGTITGGDVDPAWFIALNRALNYHWFPTDLGVFSQSHYQNFLPLLSMAALTAWALTVTARDNRVLSVEVAAGLVALVVVAGLGVFIAEFVPVPTLIKLALHRASKAAAMIGAVFIVHALWIDLRFGRAPERCLAAMLLLLPFQSVFGLVPGLAVARIALAAIRVGRPWAPSAGLATGLVVSALLLVLMVVYWATGLAALAPDRAYAGIGYALIAVGLLAAIWPHAARWLHRPGLADATWRARAMFAAVAVSALVYTPHIARTPDEAVLQRARFALEAQLWARENTPVGGLFLVDPSLGYMWRDKSHRPSFGTVREWLLISIMYNSRADLLEEGMRRLEAIGGTRPTYLLDPPVRSMPLLFNRVQGEANQAFDNLDREAFRRLAEGYGVDYVVFDRARSRRALPLSVIFENSHFAIARID